MRPSTSPAPPVSEVAKVLSSVASQFGFNPAETVNYNNKFRNKVLAYISAERLLLIYASTGVDGVVAEITKFKSKLN